MSSLIDWISIAASTPVRGECALSMMAEVSEVAGEQVVMARVTPSDWPAPSFPRPNSKAACAPGALVAAD